MEVTFARFVQALRNADVRVSPAETLDAFAVASLVGVGDKRLLRDSLGMALAKSREDKARFDDAFERFFLQLAFRDPAKRTLLAGADRDALLAELDQTLSPNALSAVASVLDDDRDSLALLTQIAAERAGIADIGSLREKRFHAAGIARALGVEELDAWIAGGGAGDGAPALRYVRQYLREQIGAYVDGQYRLHVDATGKRSLVAAALKSNLGRLPVTYHHEVRSAVERLAERLARAHRRKRRRAARGLLDLKRTLRRNLPHDGVLFDLRWRRVTREQARVYVLCDVSDSVARVARFLLLFLYELHDLLPNLRAFAFSNVLGEVTDTFAGKPAEAAVEEALFAWGKGATDYGRALRDFRELCGQGLNHRSTIIVLGDGRNNYFDPGTAIFKELARRVKQVFWLNPETRDQWDEGDSEMRRYAPHCLEVTTCNRVAHIEAFADRLLTATR